MDRNRVTISFMFPVTSGVMGGVQMLLINLIPYIVKNDLANVRLYDYTYGLVKQELDKKEIVGYEFISLDSSNWKIPNKGDEVFILTGGLWLTYPYFLKVKESVKIIVWDVYYPYWRRLGRIKGLKIPYFREDAMKLLSDKNGVVFMEKKGLDVFHDNNLMLDKFDDVVVPVSVYTKSENIFLSSSAPFKTKSSDIVIAYIGRAVDWKMYPVKKLVSDLQELSIKAKVIIYTDDSKKFSEFIDVTSSKLKIEYKEGFWGEVLEKDVLDNQVVLGYSMGTAALDLAKLGIPTILADFSDKDFPSTYKYKFLHQAGIGNLGADVLEVLDDGERHTLESIIENTDLAKLSAKSFEFVNNMHGIDVTARKLIAAAGASRMELRYLSRLKYKIFFALYLCKRIFNKNSSFYGWGIK